MARRRLSTSGLTMRSRRPNLSLLLLLLAAAALVGRVGGVRPARPVRHVPAPPSRALPAQPAESRPQRQPAASQDGKLTVWFLDVGQGDSELIRTPAGQFILIDAGETNEGERVVSYLRDRGVSELALVVASHAHSDHIGGMRDVLAAFPVRMYMDPGFPYPSRLYESLLRDVKQLRIPARRACEGFATDLGGAHVEVLAPGQAFIRGTDSDVNENSAVLRISYGDTAVLFPGDIQRRAIEALLTSGRDLHAQVLKVAHHGSYSGTTPELLAAVRPEVAVISCGANNEYGHPHQETLDILRYAGSRVYRTDRNGTVTVTSDGRRISVATERSQQ